MRGPYSTTYGQLIISWDWSVGDASIVPQSPLKPSGATAEKVANSPEKKTGALMTRPHMLNCLGITTDSRSFCYLCLFAFIFTTVCNKEVT